MIRLSMSTLVSWANIFKEPSTNSSEARASSWASRSGWRLISFLQSERMGWRALPPLLMKSWYTLAVQRSIFGAERIDGMREAAPANQKHIQRYLSDNCFGDFLTRGGLDVKMRELLTFSMLVSLGGCESQVKGHIAGNANIGNDKATLLAVVTQLLPYIGYPRTLNGIACLNEVLPEK